jgi:uncharacterized protein YjbI with pentapeptide repeats
MKFEIKSRWSGSVLFSIETESWKLAVEAAVKSKVSLADANLAGAYLADANLAGAYLADANLAGANLAGANLAGANLAGANLAGAYLAGAYLAGAYLAGANLAGANLAGAYLADAKLLGNPLIIGPIGSRSAYAYFWPTDKGLRVTTGCFSGSVDDFAAAVRDRHGDGKHGKDYLAAIALAKAVLPSVAAEPSVVSAR